MEPNETKTRLRGSLTATIACRKCGDEVELELEHVEGALGDELNESISESYEYAKAELGWMEGDDVCGSCKHSRAKELREEHFADDDCA